MPDSRSQNRSMFWRILRRLLSSNRGRLSVILLALGAGAAVSAALLNLKIDAQRRLSTEFRSFGPNVVITPRFVSNVQPEQTTIPESYYDLVPKIPINRGGKSGELYLVIGALTYQANIQIPAVVVGTRFEGSSYPSLPRFQEFSSSVSRTEPNCVLGTKVAEQLQTRANERIFLRYGGREETCHVTIVWSTGDERDAQIAVDLAVAQRLAALPGRISLIQISVPGTPKDIADYVARLQLRIPDADVRPVRQFTEAQAKIYSRISGVLTATVFVVLLLTALCVLAAMTNVAMERRQDVAMMKAIGGSARRVTRIFLTEAALLGLVGGLIGAAVGIAISMGLGKAVFGVAAQPRLIVYPISVALTLIVAILASYPLRHLANVKPASIFRGEA